MATISVSVARGSGVAIRPHINGFQYIEAQVCRGSGVATDPKIGSGIGSSVIVVDEWDPADNSYNVPHLSSFFANLHADAGIIEKEILWDDGTDFDNGGTHNGTVAGATAIALETAGYGTDFDDYTSGNITAQTETWFARTTTGNMYMQDVGTPTRRVGQISIGNYTYRVTYDESGTSHNGGVIKTKMRRTTSGYTDFGVCFNMTGSGTAQRGYQLCWTGGQYISLYRITGATSVTHLVSKYVDYADQNVWYNLHVYFLNTGTYMTCYFKLWEEGTSEPGSFTGLTNDTTYDNPGAIGFMVRGSATSRTYQFDEFYFEPDPAVYGASGDWTSDELGMTDIVNYSHALLSWDETTPTDTTLAVKARWDTGGTWLACTNGAQLPGITLGADTTAGSSKESLELKVELATTDNSVTPELENLRFYHEPVANSALVIEVDGVDHVEADRSLEIWGKQQVVGGVNTTGWDDVSCRTNSAYSLQGLLESLVVKLIYNDVEIDDIVVSMDWNYWCEWPPYNEIRYSMDPIKYASAPTEVRWVCISKWAPMGHNYDWILIDRSIAIHADIWWLCGHYQINDHPGSVIVGAVTTTDHPGSVQVEGWRLNDSQGSALVQGWRFDDFPGMVLPGVWEIADYPGSAVVGVRHHTDHPGMVVVYGVNRDGHVEIDVVSPEAWAAMVAAGYSVEP